MKTKKKQTKSQRASQVYNTLPTKVSRVVFNRYIKPHLSKRKRGRKPKLSYYKIFSHILYILHTGSQWENLPERRVHWTNIYKHFNRWSKDGSLERVFEGSLNWLKEEEKLNLKILHGDGSNVVAKKGDKESATRGTNTKEARKALISKTIQGM